MTIAFGGHALVYRDFGKRQDIINPPSPDPKITERWRARLANGSALSEALESAATQVDS